MKGRKDKVIWILAGVLAVVTAGYVALFGPGMIAGAAEDPPYIDYRVEQRIRSASEDRTVVRRLMVGRFGLGYDYEEVINGALTPQVTTRSFSHRRDGWFFWLPAEALGKDLVKARVCALKDEAYDKSSPYDAYLHVGIGKTECQLSFSTPPIDPRRAGIDRILTGFARKEKLDRPGWDAKATTTEGDAVAPQSVTIADLMARRDAYDGKRIAVTGYLAWEFEGADFCEAVKPAPPVHVDGIRCLWYGEPSSFAKPDDVRFSNYVWQRVEGIFVKGPNGHMGMYLGTIDRLTRITVVPPPN